jgi:hypothetical protein
MHKHEEEKEQELREEHLKAVEEVAKDDADVAEKRGEILKEKHEKKAKRQAEAAAEGKILPEDSESSDEDDLVHPVKAGETVMDTIAPKANVVPEKEEEKKEEQAPASLAQGGFLVESPMRRPPATKASKSKTSGVAKAAAKPAAAQSKAASKSKASAKTEKAETKEKAGAEGKAQAITKDAKAASPLASKEEALKSTQES